MNTDRTLHVQRKHICRCFCLSRILTSNFRRSVSNARSLRMVASRKSLKACHRCRCFYWQSTDKHLHPPVENSSTSHFLNAGKQSTGYFVPNRVSRKSRANVSSWGEKVVLAIVIVHRYLVLIIQQCVKISKLENIVIEITVKRYCSIIVTTKTWFKNCHFFLITCRKRKET